MPLKVRNVWKAKPTFEAVLHEYGPLIRRALSQLGVRACQPRPQEEQGVGGGRLLLREDMHQRFHEEALAG